MEKAQDRLNILAKIDEYEKAGKFDVDVEADPPTIPLMPNKVDYLNKKLSSKFFTFIANKLAVAYFEKLISQNKLIIEKVYGMENFTALSSVGAVITCNHFNAYDNYSIQKALSGELKKARLYKVIREGNYTSFGGLYGFFFKHCNTLPLSSNKETMILFMKSVAELLRRGDKVMVYPEQAMWWNYKKPRPLKSGAFKLAAKNNAPVLPIFITMKDSDIIGEDGFAVQKYSIHILPAIYPQKDKSVHENTEAMKEQNYKMWIDKYEEVYQVKLIYGGETPCCTE